MRNKKSNGSSAVKRANNKHLTARKKSNGADTQQASKSALRERVGKLEIGVDTELEIIRAEKAAMQELLEKAKAQLREAEAKLPTQTQDEPYDPFELDLKTVVLSEEQILELQQMIGDYFKLADLDDWKKELETIFNGWVCSKELHHMRQREKNDIVFTYHKVVRLFERLAPFYATIDGTYRAQKGLEPVDYYPVRREF